MQPQISTATTRQIIPIQSLTIRYLLARFHFLFSFSFFFSSLFFGPTVQPIHNATDNIAWYRKSRLYFGPVLQVSHSNITMQVQKKQLPPPASARPRAATSTLYFAYGSNLHVAQMAQRCPESVFLGTAVLPGYRWQINQRGVANVVAAPNHFVEGLVFRVGTRDERALDRSEGVSRSLYLKQNLSIIFRPHKRHYNSKSSQLAQILARPLTPEDPSKSTSSELRNAGPDDSEEVEALVYVSEKYNKDGDIREEYIARLGKAAADAVTLGVSRSFVDHVIGPHITSGILETPPPAVAPTLHAPVPASHDPMQIDSTPESKPQRSRL